MPDDAPLSREEAQRRWHEHRERQRRENPDAAEPPPVPWDYKARVKTAAEIALRAKSITRGVTVAAEKEGPRVLIICTRQSQRPVQLAADCQVTYEDGMEPEQLGRAMVEELEEKLAQLNRGEIRL